MNISVDSRMVCVFMCTAANSQRSSPLAQMFDEGGSHSTRTPERTKPVSNACSLSPPPHLYIDFESNVLEYGFQHLEIPAFRDASGASCVGLLWLVLKVFLS